MKKIKNKKEPKAIGTQPGTHNFIRTEISLPCFLPSKTIWIFFHFFHLPQRHTSSVSPLWSHDRCRFSSIFPIEQLYSNRSGYYMVQTALLTTCPCHLGGYLYPKWDLLYIFFNKHGNQGLNIIGHFFLFFLKILFICFLERGEGRKRGRETSMCGCLLCTPYWGPGRQPRPVPWLGIEPATL